MLLKTHDPAVGVMCRAQGMWFLIKLCSISEWAHSYYVTLCVRAGSVCGLQVLPLETKSLEKASGETVTLDCTFSLSAQDIGPLDIEWSIQPSDNQKEEKVVSVRESATCTIRKSHQKLPSTWNVNSSAWGSLLKYQLLPNLWRNIKSTWPISLNSVMFSFSAF